jgi:phosphoglycerate dehydrogenase-like enzyme
LEILLLQDLAEDAHAWLAARHRVHYRPDLLNDPALLRAELANAHALVAPSSVMINRALLDGAPQLVAVGRMHGDSETMDLMTCHRRGVRVVLAASTTARARAEYLLFTLLQLFRTSGDALPCAPGQPGAPGREINDSVIGLFGLTPPAQTLATLLVPLGARVVGYDPALHRKAELWQRVGVQPMTLAGMLKIADAVSIQLPYASRYQGLIGARVLAGCKLGQLWTCISRPSLFDLEALAAKLRSGRVGGLMIDSDDPQVTAPDSPLRHAPHVTITPALASHTQESHLRGSWYLVDRLHDALTLSAGRASVKLPSAAPALTG